MPRVDLDLKSEIRRSPRVLQLEGVFDVPEARDSKVSYHFDVPIEDQPWQIGCIVGPSGAGKSTVARALFPDAMSAQYAWPRDAALVDGFPAGVGIREISAALSSVGFSSPPSWLRPYAVLSNGEKFRADMARALVSDQELVVVDEFTSVVDRTVAMIGSAAIAKAFRRSTKRFVAVSCHDDIVDWLQPDWILAPHVSQFTWRCLRRRPPVHLEVRRVPISLWHIFAPHHYMTAGINRSARCFAAFWRGRVVAFSSWLPFAGRLGGAKRAWRTHRNVVLPDYQGIGIGTALVDAVASSWAAFDVRVFHRTAHPGDIAAHAKSSHWRCTAHGFASKDSRKDIVHTGSRRAASFEYFGNAMSLAEAKQLHQLAVGRVES